jgi:hypothetical protein
MLNDVIHFKVHIQGRLENYEDFLAQQVDREMEEQEQDVANAVPAGDVQMEVQEDEYVVV